MTLGLIRSLYQRIARTPAGVVAEVVAVVQPRGQEDTYPITLAHPVPDGTPLGVQAIKHPEGLFLCGVEVGHVSQSDGEYERFRILASGSPYGESPAPLESPAWLIQAKSKK